MNNHRSLLAAVACLTLLATPACAKKNAAPPSAANDQPVLSVTVATAHRGDIAESISLAGSVAPRQQANISSVITGQVLSVNASVGDRVSAGEVLVKIDDSTLRAQLAQNESNLQQAQARLAQTQSSDVGSVASANANLASAQVAYQTALANLRRNQSLMHQGYVSQSAVDQAQQAASAAEAQLRSAQVAAQNAQLGGANVSSAQSEIRSLAAAVEQARAAVSFAQAQLGQTVITAPFDGVLTQRSVDAGALASPGTPLVQVSQLNPVYVNVGIPEEDLPYIHAGTSVTVRVDSAPGRLWHGTVAAINGATSQGTLSYLARIVLPNPDFLLKGGMVASVDFVKAERRDVVIVPRGAIFQGDNGDAIYVLAAGAGCKKCDGKAKVVTVRRGLETGTESEINAPGITAGTKVIVQRPDQLRDGSPVSISSAGLLAPNPPRT